MTVGSLPETSDDSQGVHLPACASMPPQPQLTADGCFSPGVGAEAWTQGEALDVDGWGPGAMGSAAVPSVGCMVGTPFNAAGSGSRGGWVHPGAAMAARVRPRGFQYPSPARTPRERLERDARVNVVATAATVNRGDADADDDGKRDVFADALRALNPNAVIDRAAKRAKNAPGADGGDDGDPMTARETTSGCGGEDDGSNDDVGDRACPVLAMRGDNADPGTLLGHTDACDAEGDDGDDVDEQTTDDEFGPLSVAELYREEEGHSPVHALVTSSHLPSPHPTTIPGSGHAGYCPVCFRDLDDVADTEAARFAHVNACLDEGAPGPEGGNERRFTARDALDEDSDGAVWDEGGEGEWHDVAAWLHAVDHGAVAEAALRARITFATLGVMTDADLREMGVKTLGARKRLLAAIAARGCGGRVPAAEARVVQSGEREVHGGGEGMGGGGNDSGRAGVDGGHSGGCWHPTRLAVTVAPVFARARGEVEHQTALPRASRIATASGATGSVALHTLSRNGGGSAGGGGGVRGKAAGGTKGGSCYGAPPIPSAPPPSPPPPWIRVPGTRFIVDGFQGYGKSHSGWCTNWFLTHFHADHYKGLTKSIPGPGCVVWCSRPTAELCRLRLGIQRERLRTIDVGRTVVVEGVKVTFVDANHCPGAVMIVFDDIPGGSGPVLATGDCRYHPRMKLEPTLRSLASRRPGPAVMLDTTYCSPQHVFPPQAEVLAAVRDSVKAEAFNPRVLFLFGTYTIGKERVFFEAARALGKKVYVGRQKRAVLDALGDTLSAEDRASVTTDDTATNLHVVPMGSTSFARMKAILRYYRARYDTVVAFKPTGWTFESSRKHARATKRQQRGSLIQYSVPYSEHSSFEELRELVAFLSPRAILPHVGNDRGPKAARMIELLTTPALEAPDTGQGPGKEAVHVLSITAGRDATDTAAGMADEVATGQAAEEAGRHGGELR